jgi:NAD(P)H dehydrogenase (quinone)
MTVRYCEVTEAVQWKSRLRSAICYNSYMSNVVVLGGSGVSGRAVLRALRVRGADVVALSRSVEGEARLRADGASVVRVDVEDHASLVAVFSGARAVYAIPPALHPHEDDLIIGALHAAVAAGVDRFVYHSVMHPHTPVLRNHMRKARVEAVLRDSTLRWSILQPSMFAQVVLAMFGGSSDGVVRVPFSLDSPLAVLDLEELAEVATKVLLEEGHEYATYELAGPITSLAEMLAAIGAARGVELRAVPVPPAQAPLPPSARNSPLMAADMISTFAHYDGHGFLGNSRVLASLLGREPATFADVACRS